MLLAMDTATPRVSVALLDGQSVLAERAAIDAMQHTEVLSPMIAATLAAAEVPLTSVDTVVVGVGPGPFTGLRVGLMTARTLARVVAARLVGACSLDAVAAEVVDRGLGGEGFGVATDARRREVYWAEYDAQGRRSEGPTVRRPAEVDATRLPVAGTGAVIYSSHFPQAIDVAYPDAARMGQAVLDSRIPSLQAEPLYLRQADARPPGPPKSVLPNR